MIAAVAACACSAPPLPWVAPHNPFDLASLELADSRPAGLGRRGQTEAYLLGTDDQGATSCRR